MTPLAAISVSVGSKKYPESSARLDIALSPTVLQWLGSGRPADELRATLSGCAAEDLVLRLDDQGEYRLKKAGRQIHLLVSARRYGVFPRIRYTHEIEAVTTLENDENGRAVARIAGLADIAGPVVRKHEKTRVQIAPATPPREMPLDEPAPPPVVEIAPARSEPQPDIPQSPPPPDVRPPPPYPAHRAHRPFNPVLPKENGHQPGNVPYQGVERDLPWRQQARRMRVQRAPPPQTVTLPSAASPPRSTLPPAVHDPRLKETVDANVRADILAAAEMLNAAIERDTSGLIVVRVTKSNRVVVKRAAVTYEDL